MGGLTGSHINLSAMLGAIGSLFTPADAGAKKSAREAGRLKNLFMGEYDSSRAASPTGTAYYSAGAGAIQDLMRRQQGADASAAAGRGMAGSTFELAQAANRQRGSADAYRGLLSDSERMQSAEEARLMQAVLQSQAMRSGALAQGDAARTQMAASLFGAGASLAGGV